MDFTNGLKIDSYDSIAKVIKVLRKYGDWSISEIKSRVESHDFILRFKSTSEEGLKTIIKCYEELSSEGVSVSLYELNDRPATIQLIKNQLEMYNEIAEETQAIMDAEAEDEDDED